jgi:hypothetical protein
MSEKIKTYADKKRNALKNLNEFYEHNANKAINEMIELDPESCVSISEINKLLKDNEAYRLSSKYVANKLNLKMTVKRINGKITRVILGCRIKSNKKG